MTIKEYLKNPLGKGDSSTNKKILINALDEKYKKYIKDNSLTYTIYKVSDSDYYIHFITPSETKRENTYDTVVRIFIDRDIDDNINIQMFSNAPSFVYTFANIYQKNNLFCELLQDRLPKEIYKKDPVIKNRYGIVGYEKHLYFACKFIDDNKLSNLSILSSKSRPFDIIVFKTKIRKFDKIMTQLKKAEIKLKKEEKKKENNTKGINTKKETKDKKDIKNSRVKKINKPTRKIKPIKKLK